MDTHLRVILEKGRITGFADAVQRAASARPINGEMMAQHREQLDLERAIVMNGHDSPERKTMLTMLRGLERVFVCWETEIDPGEALSDLKPLVEDVEALRAGLS